MTLIVCDVVDQYVDVAECICGCGNRCFQSGNVGHVTGREHGLMSRCRQLGLQRVRRGCVDIAKADLGALTRMLDRLACKGWIERLPNPHDKRGVLVKLTDHGAAICEQCHQLVGQDLHQELTKNLTADEVATLEHLLKRILP